MATLDEHGIFIKMSKSQQKLPDNIQELLKDAKELGSKSNICKKYNCTRQTLDNFLFRRGYKIEAKTTWELRPLTEKEKNNRNII